MRFKCGVCRKTFRTENGLNWHLENIHGQVKTFEVDDSSNDVGHQAADLHNPLAAVNAVAQGVAVADKVQRMMGQSGPLPATQAELVELIEGVVSEQVNDVTSATSGLLDLREIDLKVQIKQMIAEMIGESDRFLRAHIEHRMDERLQAITPIHREETKVKDGSNSLAPYLRDDSPAKDESDPLAPYLQESRPARPMKITEMGCEFSTTFTGCSLHRGHQRPRYSTRPMGVPSDEVIRDSLKYCGYAV